MSACCQWMDGGGVLHNGETETGRGRNKTGGDERAGRLMLQLDWCPAILFLSPLIKEAIGMKKKKKKNDGEEQLAWDRVRMGRGAGWGGADGGGYLQVRTSGLVVHSWQTKPTGGRIK